MRAIAVGKDGTAYGVPEDERTVVVADSKSKLLDNTGVWDLNAEGEPIKTDGKLIDFIRSIAEQHTTTDAVKRGDAEPLSTKLDGLKAVADELIEKVKDTAGS